MLREMAYAKKKQKVGVTGELWSQNSGHGVIGRFGVVVCFDMSTARLGAV